MNDEIWSGEWVITADLPGRERFFPLPTMKKPDIVIWCEERLIVHLIELTVLHEDDNEAAQIRKNERYENLIEECKEAGWSVKHFPVEVGCKGFVGNRLRSWLFATGLCHRQVSKLSRKSKR